MPKEPVALDLCGSILASHATSCPGPSKHLYLENWGESEMTGLLLTNGSGELDMNHSCCWLIDILKPGTLICEWG